MQNVIVGSPAQPHHTPGSAVPLILLRGACFSREMLYASFPAVIASELRDVRYATLQYEEPGRTQYWDVVRQGVILHTAYSEDHMQHACLLIDKCPNECIKMPLWQNSIRSLPSETPSPNTHSFVPIFFHNLQRKDINLIQSFRSFRSRYTLVRKRSLNTEKCASFHLVASCCFWDQV